MFVKPKKPTIIPVMVKYGDLLVHIYFIYIYSTAYSLQKLFKIIQNKN